MHPTARGTLFGATALIAAFALPAGAQAPDRLDPVHVTASRLAEANELDERAATLYDHPKKWGKAARLHEQAGELRVATDARGFRSLRMAGYLYYAAGKTGKASELMARAADQATARGDVFAAANAYVEAGLLAIEAKQNADVPDFARKAVTLASSPLLTEEQRNSITSRVGYSELAALGAPLISAP